MPRCSHPLNADAHRLRRASTFSKTRTEVAPMAPGSGTAPSSPSVRSWPIVSCSGVEHSSADTVRVLLADWIHDAVKNSSRLRRARGAAKRSLRARIFLALDRLQGWVIVTLIGLLTALVAFSVVRGESELVLGASRSSRRPSPSRRGLAVRSQGGLLHRPMDPKQRILYVRRFASSSQGPG